MKNKFVKSYLPVALLLSTGAAHADLAPYSFGASETIQHDSNVYRSTDSQRNSDWISVTELRAALDQAIGRDRLEASATVDFNRYKHLTSSDATAYLLAGAFDWSVPGNISGKLGADSQRHQYFYGLNGETQSTGHNIETDNHVYANAQIGGVSRWTIFGGLDANDRRYSNDSFSVNDENQWGANLGTRYSTSPDLTFGIAVNYQHGYYPNLRINGVEDSFNTRSVDLTTTWQASGNSSLDARVGVTSQDSTGESGQSFVNGALNWTWHPPSHFIVNVGLARDSNSTTGIGSVVNANDLTGRSINNSGHITLNYELSAKIGVVATALYASRHYGNSVLPIIGNGTQVVSLNGTNRTASFSLAAHYKPTRTTDLSCSAAREVRRTDAQLQFFTPAYTDTLLSCTAGIQFN
jgi:hypothetical protein